MKLSIVFILLLFTIAAPAPGVSGSQNSSDATLLNSQSAASANSNVKGLDHHPVANSAINASAAVNRTVTVKTNAQIILQDDISVTIKDNLTKIYAVNYTIPTAYAKYVIEEHIYVKHESFIDIENDSYVAAAEVFQGLEATTYQIDVTNHTTDEFNVETTTPLDINSSVLKIRIVLRAADAITWKIHDEDQRGIFIAPVRGLLSNIRAQSVVKIALEGTNNVFSAESTGAYSSVDNTLSFTALVADTFDPVAGLEKDVDYITVVFDSTNPQEEVPVVTVPSRFIDLQRTVRIDPYGTVFVTEEFTVLHTGAVRPENPASYRQSYGIQGVQVAVDTTATVTDVYDSMGSLNLKRRNSTTDFPLFQTTQDANHKIVEVFFRNVIFGGDTYTFDVTYQYPASAIISHKGSLYTLNTTLFSRFNDTVDNMEVVFQLPERASFVDQTFLLQSTDAVVNIQTQKSRFTLSFFQHIELVYDAQNVRGLDNNEFQIVFKYNQLYAFTSIVNYFILSLLGITLFVGAAYLLGKVTTKKSRDIEVQREKIPVNELTSFLNAFTDYHDSLRRLEDMIVKRQKGKMSKREFDASRDIINTRVNKLNADLDKAVKASRTIPQKYRTMVEKIMLASTRQQDLRSSIKKNARDFKNKAINKEIYLKINADYREQIKKLESQINRGMTEISELIQ